MYVITYMYTRTFILYIHTFRTYLVHTNIPRVHTYTCTNTHITYVHYIYIYTNTYIRTYIYNLYTHVHTFINTCTH
jgi:hypothetical protein